MRLAIDLAEFLVQLRSIEPLGPRPGQHSAGRGAPLDQWDAELRDTMRSLAGRIDQDAAEREWDRALAARPVPAPELWFHGDVAPGNLLLRDGRLAAVIDFGIAGVGDPACDLAVAWTWFDSPARAVFRDIIGVDDETWARGRGWALWKALIALDDPRHAEQSRHALAALGVLRER